MASATAAARQPRENAAKRIDRFSEAFERIVLTAVQNGTFSQDFVKSTLIPLCSEKGVYVNFRESGPDATLGTRNEICGILSSAPRASVLYLDVSHYACAKMVSLVSAELATLGPVYTDDQHTRWASNDGRVSLSAHSYDENVRSLGGTHIFVMLLPAHA